MKSRSDSASTHTKIMNPKNFTLVTAFLVGTTLANERPNIILMMADDMGWGDPSYNSGSINTPALDAMAAQGLRFDRFYSASAVCSPTRGSCLTGRHPLRLGIPHANQGRLEADETPLSEVLDDIGYATGHFGKWHLGTMTTLRSDSNRGSAGNTSVYSPPWQHHYDFTFATEAKVPTFHPMRRTVNGLPEPTSFGDPNFYGTYYWTPPANPIDWPSAAEGTIVQLDDNLSGDDSRVIIDRVIPFVQDAVAAGDPFFTVVWFHTPHKPLPDPGGITGVDSDASYTDAIVGMDTQIARLRAELDTLGVTDNTMFWFCSDNGPENGVGSSGPYRARKRSLHEGGVRVPGLLVWPDKISAPMTSDFPAVTSDYYPTILDYLCIDVPGQKPLDGVSLRGVIENTMTEREVPIGFNFENERSWVDQRYKLISKNNGSTFELYDLIEDEREITNIAAANPLIVARMTQEFQTWQTAVNNDTEYLPPVDAPKSVLSTASGSVQGQFDVEILFSESVTNLVAEDFDIANGTAIGLTGSGDTYLLSVTPIAEGTVTLFLPAGSVEDSEMNPNQVSNTLAVFFGTRSGSFLIDDHFDGETVSGWIGQGNGQTFSAQNIAQTNSVITSEVTATAANVNRGIVSEASFDPSASGGFTMTFEVESVSATPGANGYFIGLVRDNDVFYRDATTRNFGLTFFGIDARTNSFGGFGLGYGDNNGPTGAEFRFGNSDEQGDVDLNSFSDGFTAVVRVNPDGWSYEITDLQNAAGTETLFTGSGAWTDSGTDFDALFAPGDNWFATGCLQVVPVTTFSIGFDRISVEGAGTASELAISSIAPSFGNDEPKVTITWISQSEQSYAVDYSTDLVNWVELNDDVPSGGDSTEFVHSFLPGFLELERESTVFYRVREIE